MMYKSLKITCYALSKYIGSERSLGLKTVIKMDSFIEIMVALRLI